MILVDFSETNQNSNDEDKYYYQLIYAKRL